MRHGMAAKTLIMLRNVCLPACRQADMELGIKMISALIRGR